MTINNNRRNGFHCEVITYGTVAIWFGYEMLGNNYTDLSWRWCYLMVIVLNSSACVLREMPLTSSIHSFCGYYQKLHFVNDFYFLNCKEKNIFEPSNVYLWCRQQRRDIITRGLILCWNLQILLLQFFTLLKPLHQDQRYLNSPCHHLSLFFGVWAATWHAIYSFDTSSRVAPIQLFFVY